ncbi:MAG: hypothetical protein ACJ748_07425 [Flavisolibacter sp.]
MKLFLTRILFFLLPLLIIVAFVEYSLRDMNNMYKAKSDGLVKNADSVKLLIIGNSHASYGINPDKFHLYAYNMAQVNQSLYFDKRVTLKYLDKLPNLKYVLLSIDYHSLYFSSEGSRDPWVYYWYGIDYKGKLNLFSKLSYIKGYTIKGSYALLKRKGLLAFDHKKKNSILDRENDDVEDTIIKGWTPFRSTNYTLMSPDYCKARASAMNDQVSSGVKERPEILADLKDFISELKKRNITPVIITAPCYNLFNSFLDKKTIEQNHNDINDLCKEFNIKYFDYMDAPFTADEFYNCDHLNEKGASRFTRILDSQLNKELALSN